MYVRVRMFVRANGVCERGFDFHPKTRRRPKMSYEFKRLI